MAATHLLTFSLLTLFLLNPTLSNLNLAVYGGVQITPTAVHLPNPSLLILNTPLSFLTPTSFSTHFSFSLSPHSTLSLLLVPTTFPQTFPNKPLENNIHLRVEFASDLVKIGNVSVKLNSGNRQRLAFVDYRAGAKLLEVRLGNSKTDRIIAFPVDLSEMWKGERVLVGLESMSNSSVVYSWKFEARIVPKGMHSRPLDPRARVRSWDVPCYLTVVSAVMIAAGVCVFVVFMVMFFKIVSTDWEQVMEMEYVLKPVGKGYEKVVSADVENNVFGNVKC